MICTIYKSGPKYDSSNCHGVTLTSCLGKLFSTLSHVKIENELEKKKYSPILKQASEKNMEGQAIPCFFLIKNL